VTELAEVTSRESNNHINFAKDKKRCGINELLVPKTPNNLKH
jgi:hypothetical protein